MQSSSYSSHINWDVLILLLGGLIVLAGMVAPLAQALLTGLASAREPGHRVTPLSPWVYFNRTYHRRLRYWTLAWFAIPSLFYVMQLIMALKRQAPPIFQYVSPLMAISIPLGIGLFSALGMYCWAPRCQHLWTLLLAGYGSGLTLFVTFIMLTLLLPRSLTEITETIQFPGGGTTNYGTSLGPIYIAILALAALAGYQRFIRRSTRWLRLEE